MCHGNCITLASGHPSSIPLVAYLLGTMERLGHEGVKEMLVIPVSFVTEHIETLHEINIDGRIDAKKYGIERFRMMPAVGDSPPFIACLKDLVLNGTSAADAAERSQPAA